MGDSALDLTSLILPYWQRQAETDKSLALLSQHYKGLEVVIVDDGSPVPFQLREWPNIDVKLIRLPDKTIAKNPCVPINIGVRNSRGDYIVLSNPEVLHEKPVLQEMLEAVQTSPMAYVVAAAWCPENKTWHCHSTRKHCPKSDAGGIIPDGVGYHFCSMLHRTLWDKAGGFDEIYRDGAGYDDPDWVMRLLSVGAEFIMRDDLVVLHPRSIKSKWPAGAFVRNREIFLRKWHTARANSIRG